MHFVDSLFPTSLCPEKSGENLPSVCIFQSFTERSPVMGLVGKCVNRAVVLSRDVGMLNLLDNLVANE